MKSKSNKVKTKKIHNAKKSQETKESLSRREKELLDYEYYEDYTYYCPVRGVVTEKVKIKRFKNISTTASVNYDDNEIDPDKINEEITPDE